MQKIVLIAFAGGLGALARYSLAGLVTRFNGQSTFPWGTLAVNILGSFAFGLIWALAEEQFMISPETRIIVLTGFMGAFTTFSTFMFETGTLLRDASWQLAMLNLIAQNMVGLMSVFAGLGIGRVL